VSGVLDENNLITITATTSGVIANQEKRDEIWGGYMSVTSNLPYEGPVPVIR
jgi:hypothetical protein